MADTTTELEKKVKSLSKDRAGKEAELKILKPKVEKRTLEVAAAQQFVEKEFFGDAGVIAKKCKTHFGKELMSLVEAREKLKKMEQELAKLVKTHQDTMKKFSDLDEQLKKAEASWKKYSEEKAKLAQKLKEGTLDKKAYEKAKEELKKTIK